MLDGTASTHVVRLVRDTALAAGVPEALVAGIPGTGSLADDRLRIPLSSLGRLWDLLAHTLPEGTAGLRVADAAPLGTMPAWDYLLVNGATLADALTDSLPYHRVVTAAEEHFEVHESSDGTVEVAYRTTVGDPRTSAAVHEYVLAYYLRRSREATGRDLVPARVAFSHPAPPDHGALVRAFGTDRVEFGAEADTIAFHARDARAPLPGGDPGLAALLRHHAEMILATARPLPGWPDLFHAALDAELDLGTPALDAVAARLALSARTLQRRLSEHGTTWRAEVDLARYERARRLLAQGLTVDTVATLLGFTDDRALRKAFRRWRGHSPGAERRALARTDRSVASEDLGQDLART
ncbi:AraC family transcriptional regulator ligand-binding domain-containing protein [Nocardiopsis sp. NPDC006198]|uniref:AraC family transcriptional regulator n=1 Tax=Nocardiopsis sp. NPDC006198 TaxID=3154472 RepID=UPI0033BA87BA